MGYQKLKLETLIIGLFLVSGPRTVFFTLRKIFEAIGYKYRGCMLREKRRMPWFRSADMGIYLRELNLRSTQILQI